MLSANSRSSILFNEVLDYAGQDEDRFFLVSIPGRPAPNGRHAALPSRRRPRRLQESGCVGGAGMVFMLAAVDGSGG